MLTYQQAKAAFEAGGRYYRDGAVFIVTRVLRPNEAGDVFWVTDADGLGDVGTLLYPDGRVEKRTPPTLDAGALL
ncbi:MAG: hypothetical protein JSV36_06325 [Anaerolineae bacterium]|nr:MAG: hypothetical protein JSV36_06325 [Anaerolineae bacterium]